MSPSTPNNAYPPVVLYVVGPTTADPKGGGGGEGGGGRGGGGADTGGGGEVHTVDVAPAAMHTPSDGCCSDTPVSARAVVVFAHAHNVGAPPTSDRH